MPIQKNASRTFAFRMVDSAGADKSGTPTVKVSKDGGAGATATNSPAAISSLSTGDWTITLTAAEMNADCVAIEATLSGAATWFQPVYPEDAYTTARAGYLDTLNGLVNAIWTNGTRTLTGFGTLVADIAAAVWGATTRTLSAFGFTVNTNANATETAIKAKTDGLPSDPADASDVAAAFAAVPGAVWGNGTRTLSAFGFNVTVGGYVGGLDPASLILLSPGSKLSTDVSGRVAVFANDDKTGYSLSTAPPTAASVATAVWANAVRTLTTLNGLTPNAAFFTSTPSGGGGSSITAADVWSYNARTLTDDTGPAATRFLTMVGLSAGAYRFTAPALALAPSGSGGETVNVVVSAPSILPGYAPTAGELAPIRRGDDYAVQITGLGDLAARTKLWVTAKANPARPDEKADFQLTEGDGLIVVSGATPTGDQAGTLTVDDPVAGKATLTLTAAATAALAVQDLLFDVQVKVPAGIKTLAEGSLTVRADVTRATGELVGLPLPS